MAPDRSAPADPALWQVQGLTKRFPGVLANDRIDLVLRAGEIHGLMGENGCGKSTLIKTLMGVHEPDGGAILRGGAPVRIDSPQAAQAAGIASVFQEFSLVPTLTVAENIFLGRLPRGRWGIDWRRLNRDAAEVLARLNVPLDPETVVGVLPVARQQLVEIAKALSTEASLLILDEPTTALGPDEIAELHAVLKGLRAQGKAILYVSHRLDEVVELVDCVTVLKDGRVVSTADRTPVTVAAIVSAMIGAVGDHYPARPRAPGEVVLEARDLRTRNRVNGASFDLRRGEVFGLGGVLGSGRTEIARALFGVDPLTGGEVRLHGRPLRLSSPGDAVAAGLALVPENRKTDGLFFNFAGPENISVARLDRLVERGVLGLGREREEARGLIRRLSVTPAAEERLVGLLSGGNQQKIVIARWLFAGAEVLILDEPTQGIDVGAKIAVYRLINELVGEGKAVVLISSDHEELLAMSDRIGIVSHGHIASIRPASEVGKSDLVRASAAPEVHA